MPRIQIKDLAEREKIPAKFLEQILVTLKNAGLLNSRMGVGGGYYLARPAQEITLGHIFRVSDIYHRVFSTRMSKRSVVTSAVLIRTRRAQPHLSRR